MSNLFKKQVISLFIYFLSSFQAGLSYGNGEKLPLVVLHGGPGLDHLYLKQGLQFMSESRELIFYDQKRCPQFDCLNHPPRLEDLIQQLEGKVSSFERYGLVAHSWGGLLAMKFIESAKRLPEEVIFITPIPLTQNRVERDFSRLFKRVSQEDLRYFNAASTLEESLLNVKQAFKYYYFDQRVHDFNGRYCNLREGDLLMKELLNFNSIPTLAKLPKRTLWIRGVADIFTADPEVKWIHIPNAGHFPFEENPNDFQKAIREFFMIQ